MNLHGEIIKLEMHGDYIALIKENRVIFSACYGNSPQELDFDTAWKITGQLLIGFQAAGIR